MGCVFGRDAAAEVGEVRVPKKAAAVAEVSSSGGEASEEVRNGEVVAVEEERRSSRPRGERRRSSRPNPRNSNPPKHLHGEQVAAGWPSWLSAVAGEAINGWTPRRADTFEKLDKVICDNRGFAYLMLLELEG